MIEPTFDFPDYRQRMTARRIWRDLNDIKREYERVIGEPFDASAVAKIMGWDDPSAKGKGKGKEPKAKDAEQ